ncbi:SPOR domain-containing protein [Cellvibrio mixtus]|uniref:SPOR domain-containing protein n=1 Tax=Cellvibrio mixtus TaxID=39650 RepID=UPI0005870B44|nr:SPOR domain-containing protein [Cellvibrio mixtus]
MRESVKHRLIGAAVLAAIAVLFLPSFFKDRQQYQVNTESQIPGRPSITAVDFNEPAQPEGVESAPAPETMFVPDSGDAAVSELPVPPAESVEPLQGQKIVASSQAQASSVASVAGAKSDQVPQLPLNAQGLPDAWVIQVASLSAQEGANKLRDQLQAEGHKAYVRAVPSANGSIYRVFIGPKQDKAQALAIKSQLDKRLKVNSLVLPFKP